MRRAASAAPNPADGSAASPAPLGLTLGGIKELIQRYYPSKLSTLPSTIASPELPTQKKPDAAPTYTVRTGDTLLQIANRNLGQADRWKEILELNKDQITEPNRIIPGMTLKMPEKSVKPTKPEKTSKPADTSVPAAPAREPNGSGPVLKIGANGEAVKQLQSRLKELGFDPGTIDGDFGPKTLAAVKNFQSNKGLEADGMVGPKTWKQLDIQVSAPASAPPPAREPNGSGPLLQSGANGESVKKLQARLKDLGFDPGTVDGDFGPKTLAAVKSFQSSKRLEVDGVVGPQTWKQLDITVTGGVSYPAPAAKAVAKSSGPSGSGPVLKSGAHGDAVKQLQSRLKDLGFDAGTPDGDFGPKTLAAVKRFQSGRGLEADGVVGPQTWKQLGITVSGGVSYASTSRASTGNASSIAQGALNLHQSGYRYPENLTDQYRYVPGKIGCCADFVCDAYREAGNDINADMEAKGYNPHYCPSMIDYFKAHQQLVSGSAACRVGDVVFFDWDGGGKEDPDHVAIVSRVDDKGRPTQLIESRSFGSRTEVTTIYPEDSRASKIAAFGRLG